MAAFHKFSLGNFRAIALEDNRQTIDIRQELGQVPEDQLLAALQAHAYPDFQIEIGFNNLLIQTRTEQVLIDCGTGNDKLVESLSDAGVDPLSIDYLVITHSDFDHIGGIDHFPNAKIVFPQLAYDLWTNTASRQEMIAKFQEVFLKFLPAEFVAKGVSYRENYGAEKLPSLRDRMIFVSDEEEFLPGFKLLFTPGHRPDHFAVEINSAGQTLLHIADGFRHSIQIQHPDWYSRFDSYPEQMAESLNKTVERAKNKEAIIFGAHFKFPALARLGDRRLQFIEE